MGIFHLVEVRYQRM